MPLIRPVRIGSSLFVSAALTLVVAPVAVHSDVQGRQTAPPASVFFVATTPADPAVLKQMGAPADAKAELIEWSLRLSTTPAGAPAGYELQYVYGMTQPNLPGIAKDRREGTRQGTWTVVEGKPRRVIRLDAGVSFAEIGPALLHLLDAKGQLMGGNGGWSYSLNRADAAEASPDASLAATVPDMSYPAPTRPTGSVFGRFEGRTPCQGIARELALTVPPGCFKLKWLVTLLQDAATRAPTTYKIEGTLFRTTPREGKWTIEPASSTSAGGRVIRLDGASPALSFLQGDDNVLFFLNRSGRLVVGNKDYNYTLDRAR